MLRLYNLGQTNGHPGIIPIRLVCPREEKETEGEKKLTR